MAVDKTLNFQVDAAVKNAQDVARLLTALQGGEKSVGNLNAGLKAVAATFKDLIAQAKQYNAALLKIQPDAKSLNLRTATRSLAGGGADTQLINASIQGQIAQFQASANQLFAKLTNTYVTGLRNFNKAIENEAILKFAQTRQTAALPDATLLKQQIQAQQVRANAALQTASVTGMRKDAEAYDKEVAALTRLKEAQAASLAATEARDKFDKQIATSIERQAALEQQLNVAKAAGNELEALRTTIKMRNLEIDRALVENGGRINASIRTQIGEVTQLNAQLRQLQTAQKVGDSRAFTSARLFGDGGQNLFAIQGQLLTNYLIMNKMFELVNFGKEFVVQLDQAFHQLQAITSTTNTEMVELQKNLLAVSQGSKFTAVEIAQASVILGQAGFSAAQIKESIQPILLFATAAGTTLPKAVDVVTSVLNQFELEASQAGNVVNVLTAALNTSKLDIDKLALGLQYAGNVAAQSGVSFLDLTTVLSAMANAGIRSGSTLGTGLRMIIADLQAPSKKLVDQLALVGLTEEDVDVKTHGLIEVLEKLHDAGFGAANAFQGFERRGASAFLAISGQLDNVDKIKESLLLTNAAVAANQIQMESLENTINRFRANLGVLADKMSGPVVAAFKALTVTMTALFGGISLIPGGLQAVGTAAIALGTAFVGIKIANLLGGFNLFTVQLTSFAATVASATAKLGPFSTILNVLARNPLLLAATAIFTIVGAFELWGAATSKTADETDRLQAVLNTADGEAKKYGDSIKNVDDKVNSLLAHYGRLSSDQAALDAEVLEAQINFGKLGLTFDQNSKSIDGLIGAYQRLRSELAHFNEAELEKARQASIQLTNSILADAAKKLRPGSSSLLDQFGAGVGLGVGKFGVGLDYAEGSGSSLNGLFTGNNTQLGEIFKFFSNPPKLGPGSTEQETRDALLAANTVAANISSLINQIDTKIGINNLGLKESEDLRDLLIRMQKGLDPIIGQLATATKEFHDNQNRLKDEQRAQFQQTDAFGELQALTANVQKQGSAFASRFIGNLSLAQRQKLLNEYGQTVIDDQKAFNDYLEKTGLQGDNKQFATSAFNGVLSELKTNMQKQEDTLIQQTSKSASQTLDNLNKELQVQESRIKPTATVSELKDARDKALKLFDEITAKSIQQKQNELKAEHLDVIDKQLFDDTKRIAEQAAAGKRGELAAKFDDAINNVQRVLDKYPNMLERWAVSFNDIFKKMDAANRAIDLNVKVAEAQLSATNLPQFRDRYSDVQRKDIEDQIAQLRVTALGAKVDNEKISLIQAQEQIDRHAQELQAIADRLANEQAAYEKLSQDPSSQGARDLQAKIKSDTEALAKGRDQLTQETTKLTAAQVDLNEKSAEYDVLSGKNIQQTYSLGEAIDRAFAAYGRASGATKNFTARFTDEMVGLFDSMGNAFSQFARDVFSHSKSIGQSFKDLARTIISAMFDIAAKEVALGLFGFVKGALGFGGGAGSTAASAIGSGVSSWNYMAGGGYIRAAGGVKTRDNQLVMGREGEFLMRNAAVDSIGGDTLAMLNAMGNRKVQSSAPHGLVESLQRKPDMVNVYLLPKDSKPTLGPKDVLLTVQDDIARGGVTKQLIRQVALGHQS